MKKIFAITICCMFSLLVLTGCFNQPQDEASSSPSSTVSPSASASVSASAVAKASATPAPVVSATPTPTAEPNATRKPTQKPKTSSGSNTSGTTSNSVSDSTTAPSSALTPPPTPEPISTPTPDRRAEYERKLAAIESRYNSARAPLDEILSQMYVDYMFEIKNMVYDSEKQAAKDRYYANRIQYVDQVEALVAARESDIAALNSEYGY